MAESEYFRDLRSSESFSEKGNAFTGKIVTRARSRSVMDLGVERNSTDKSLKRVRQGVRH